MEENIIELKAVGKEKENKITHAKFIAWKVELKDGTNATLKFRRQCSKQLPEEGGRYIFTVNLNDVNSRDTDYGIEYWVQNVIDWRLRENVTNLDPDNLPF